MTLYGLINLTVSKATDHPVYSPLSWDSVLSWFTALMMVPLALGFFMGLYFVTRLKFRCLKMEDAKSVMYQGGDPAGTWLLKNRVDNPN